MSFVSFEFGLFLGAALLVFHLAPARWRPGLLLGFSFGFYLSWSVGHTVLLAGVTAGVYATGLWIESRRSERGKRSMAAVGVMSLLVLMFGFKSAWWFVKTFAESEHSKAAAVVIVVVPLGLSYYTFKMIGYLLDVYWETLPAQRSFVAVALYGTFFPQIVSGPIQRAGDFFSQLERVSAPDPAGFVIGLKRILWGLGKKLIIADNLAPLVANIHGSPSAFSPPELLIGAYCYAIQLYADFSGLTDIAIGVGLLFGIKGPENFDFPYFSPNIQQFWRRWHMSLTSWLTDYLFTPLRMALRRWGTAGLCMAIFINTTAIGLWHGVSWTFVTFGMLHGVFVLVSVQTMKRRNRFFQDRPGVSRWRAVAAPLITFHLVVFSLIFFRAETFHSAFEYIAALAGFAGTAPAWRVDSALLGVSVGQVAFYSALFLASETLAANRGKAAWSKALSGAPPFLRRAAYAGLAVTVLLMFKGKGTFIYAGF